MADIANPQVVDALTIDNLKTIGAILSHQMGVLVTEQTSHLAAMNKINQASYQAFILKCNELDPKEAVAIAKTLKSDLGETLGQLGSVVATIQQFTKAAGNTPPVTP